MADEQEADVEQTVTANREAVALYDMDERQDFADADRGSIVGFRGGKVLGHVIFDQGQYDYIADDVPAPDTVNPSLWRQSQLKGGLYKVVDGLHQARDNDIANLTIVEGDDGLVIIDCMAGVESARQGLDLFREHGSDKPAVHDAATGGARAVVLDCETSPFLDVTAARMLSQLAAVTSPDAAPEYHRTVQNAVNAARIWSASTPAKEV